MIPEYPTSCRIPGLRELWQLSFGDDDAFLDDFFATGYSPDRCRCLVLEGRVAAALYWFDCQYEGRDYAYLYAVATHPDFRHRGLIRYLIADTHQLLSQAGYAGAMLVPADEGLRQMYTAMGYGNCTSVSQFTSSSLPETVLMHPVTKEEYQRLRRERLPQGAVLQEGASLDFLATQAKFYAGPEFLLCCAAGENGSLSGLEFLGNPAVAPGLLCTLGYAQGSFQTPGDKLPYAMLCPLTKDCPRPAYFGLALG